MDEENKKNEILSTAESRVNNTGKVSSGPVDFGQVLRSGNTYESDASGNTRKATLRYRNKPALMQPE